ncbi:MAG: RtcB family protein [Turicibacter sp.]|nr:RtcB family protein [Turicibacter sp.]
MLELKGAHNEAKVFTDNIDDKTIAQIVELCNEAFTVGSKIRIMPDTHVGKGSVIGTTMTITDKIVPNLVGVDVGCGMSVAKLNVQSHKIDFKALDKVIRTHVPSGFNVRKKAHPYAKQIDWSAIVTEVDVERAKKSIGTLGGGNHFIEVNKGSDGAVYLVIHSGSRNLGKQIAENYQKRAYEELVKKSGSANKHLAYLEGQGFDDYLNDMNIAQKFAALNRKAMIAEITTQRGWDITDEWESIHNFIDTPHMILRKGATSAQKGERLLIPINMRDGSIIAVGKGNLDWNFSAPHGAGRVMSRSKAKNTVKFEDFQASMRDVWTTSVHKSTIDESPFVYKPMEEIVANIGETVEIMDVIKPLYNFKA